MSIRYAEKLQVIHVMAPNATTVADDDSAHVRVTNAQWISFLMNWESMTSDTTDILTIKIYSTTAGDTNNAVSQPFKYRLQAAVGSDTWGAITSATAAAGVTLTATDDNKAILIDIDPASMYALDPDAEFVHLMVDSAMITNPAFGGFCILEPRYPQNANLGTTA